MKCVLNRDFILLKVVNWIVRELTLLLRSHCNLSERVIMPAFIRFSQFEGNVILHSSTYYPSNVFWMLAMCVLATTMAETTIRCALWQSGAMCVLWLDRKYLFHSQPATDVKILHFHSLKTVIGGNYKHNH